MKGSRCGKMGKIYYVMGKSSSGKDTIYKRLQECFPKFRNITLYTTRPIREGETDGVEYFFVDEERLREIQESDCLIEKRSYNTQYGIWTYFTADDGQIDLSRYDYLVIGTLESFQDMKAYFGEEFIVPVYIEVEDGMRLHRALQREMEQKKPGYAEMCRRFLADSEDFSEQNLRKSGIVKRFENVKLEDCIEEIRAYIRAEGRE